MIRPQLPGFAIRPCPVCRCGVDTHREPVSDDRGEIVFYHPHEDPTERVCAMSGKTAALRAVAFTTKAVA